MKYITKKLLFLLSQNARSPLKKIGSTLKQSIQTTAYQIKALEKKGLRYNTIIDYSKISHNNILVGFTLKTFDKGLLTKCYNTISEQDEVISVEKKQSHIDLLVEYSVPNLSRYNKIHTQLMDMFHAELSRAFIYPVIVKHSYPRSYLIRGSKLRDLITQGDRDLVPLNQGEKDVLSFLQKDPRAKLIDIAKKSKLSIRQVTEAKKKLEKALVIRKYSLANMGMFIKRDSVLIKFTPEGYQKIDAFTEFAKLHQNIIELYKILGEYHILLIIESVEGCSAIEDIRKEFLVEKLSIL